MIRVIFPGKTRATFLEAGLTKFTKLIRRYPLEIIQGKGGGLHDEALFIKKHLRKGDFLVALEIRGPQLDSEQFAELMESRRNITFIIGGDQGIPREITATANRVISISPMTFGHELALLILMEQLYRAQCIASNHPYHRR